MRSEKTTEAMMETLKNLLDELILPRNAQRAGNYYKVGYWFRKDNDADKFRRLLLFNIGFNGVRIESHTTYHRTPGYLIYVTWHASEQEDLIKNIERYLQEDNMGPTNINRENTKFYAIVADERGKETVYEITHSSLTSRMEYCFGQSSITHALEFDQDRLVPCNCTFAEWAKQKDELEKLRAENEQLKARLGNCENQLRNACEFLNGYGDEHIDIPTELKNLDCFSSVVNYTSIGENNRREFGKKVAEQVKKLAGWYGAWREPKTAEMMIKDKEVLEDAVETAMNSFYISSDYVKADRVYIQKPAFDASAICKSIQLSLNSWYGLTSAVCLNATKTKPTPIFNAYDNIKDVKFANPATIVFWKDGTKTVVKAQGDEQYVPEVGLAMCICKKVMGNTRDYYRVFKHWMKKV